MSSMKTRICSLCGDMVVAERKECPRCGQSLDDTPSMSRRQRVTRPINRKAAIHLAENSPELKKTATCPSCGEIVKLGWGECSRCGESLEQVMAFPSVWYENPVTANQTMNRSGAYESTGRNIRIKTCTLCGDMVRDDWKECPRCGEAL